MSTKKQEVTDKPIKYSCEFCKREFAKESTIFKHICEYKHRWLEKDKHSNRVGYQTFLQFYKKHSASKTVKPYEEYIRSPYYSAFARFGSYCVDAKVINISRYVEWLLQNQIKIDVWNTDSNYTRFLIEYLRMEDAFDAIHRGVEHCINQGEIEGLQPNDILRFGNTNRICQAIVSGKISPWMLYCSESGVRLLETLNPDQVTMIHDYINPEQWALKFHRDTNLKEQIKDTLKAAGY